MTIGAGQISVILVVRNGEAFLGEALESILAQTLSPAEVLVVDGHSTDSTVAIAESFDKVRCIQQQGAGISHAWNTGITNTQTEFVAFASHDDLWMPEKLALQLAPLCEDRALGLTACRIHYFVDGPGPLPPGFRPELLERDPVAFVLETLVVRRSVLEQIGGFDTKLTIAEDIDWFARARDAGIRHHVVDRVLLRKRVHRANSSLRHGNDDLIRALRNSILRKRRAAAGGAS